MEEAVKRPQGDRQRNGVKLPKQVPIVVIGGGISGASISYHLGKFAKDDPSKRHVLLEARGIGFGATGRNGGIVQPKTFYEWPKLARKYGIWTAFQMIRFERANRAAIRDYVIGPSRDTCGYIENLDAIMAFEDEKDFRKEASIFRLSPFKQIARFFGVDVITPGQCKEEWMQGAIRIPKAADSLSSIRFSRSLVSEAQQDGVSVIENIRVTGVRANENGNYTVETDSGHISCQHVVYATNAWTPALLPEFQRCISPVINHVVSVPVIWSNQSYPPTRAAYGLYPGYKYWVTRDDRVILGGFRDDAAHKGIGISRDDEIDPEMSRACERFLHSRKIGNKGRNENLKSEGLMDHQWTGVLGWSCDNLPWVGPIPGAPNQWICAGFSGHGLPVAFLCGKAIASALANKNLSKIEWLDAGSPPKAFLPTPERLEGDGMSSWNGAGD